MRNFYKNLKSVVLSQTEGQQPRNLQGISMLSLRFTHMRYAICVLMMLVMGVGNVCGKTFYAKCRVISEPSIGGYVYVAQNKTKDVPYTKTDDITGTKGEYVLWASSADVEFYAYQKANEGFTFKGWAGSATDQSGYNSVEKDLTGNGRTPYYELKVNTNKSNESSPQTGIYYAIFAGIVSTSNTASGSIDFEDVDVNDTKELTFVFKHAHAGKISGTKSGSHQSDFTLKTSLPTNSTTQANCTITVAFKPSCGGSRSATLTLTGDNGGSMSISLSGNGVRHTPSISTTNGSVNVSVGSTATTTNLNDRVTCDNTDGAKTYTKANNSDPVTISGSNFSATKAGEYTVNVSVAQTCYYATQTGSFKITVNRLDPTFTATNGEVNVSIDGINSSSLNLADKISYGGNGTVSYKVVSTNKANATISGSSFSATACGDYTIRAVATQTDQYLKDSVEFTVKVNKLQPTFSWAMTGADDHIYAGDVLSNVAKAKYGEANVSGLTYSYSSNNTGVVVVDGTTLRVQSTGFTTNQQVTISVSTAENDYYKEGSDSHEYTIEPKQTPEFYMNGNAIPEENAELHLKIGETANFSFDKVDESKFSTPQNPQYVSYVHNSTNHTGVLTATTAGDETILFSQTGTSLINAGSRSVHVYVERHPVSLATTLDGGTWKVDSIYTGAVYSITNGDGVHALSGVTVTSDDETVLKKVDGNWKAVGAGTATLTISHANTNYWAAETVYAHITVEKYTPVFTWNLPETVNWNKSFSNPVTSTNTEEGCTFSYSSNNTAAINWTNNALRTFEKDANNVEITVTQAGNYKWAEKTQKFNVNVQKLPNHVELTVNSQAIYNAVIDGGSGERVFDASSGIRLGGSSTSINFFDQSLPAYNWDDKYVIINFEGIPEKVSFSYRTNNSSATSANWYVQESADGKTGWTEVWSNDSYSKTESASATKTLNPATRYLKLCYSGNFAGYFKKVKITERTEVTGAKTVDFGEADASSDPTEKSTNINWYNVNPLTLTIEGTNASQFTVDKSSIEAKKDSFAENVSLKLTYKHDRAAVKDTATLVISDGTTTKKIGLKGVTNKITPAITWKENLTPMQRGVGVKNPATAPVTLVYTSTDSTVVDIIGDSIVPLKKGTATITASFDGTNDGVYNSTSSTKDVVVTDVKVQHINWTQNFKRLKWTDKEELSDKNTADFALVATVSYYDVDKEEEITIDRPITFTSNNDEVVQVLNGTTLHVVGIGETTLTAHVEGIADSLYEATVTRDVKVREPSLDCDIFVLDNASCKMTTSITDVTGTEQVFPLSGEPEFLTFSAWREAIKVVIEYSKGNLFVAQKVNGNWVDLVPDGLELDKDKSKDFGPYELNRKATDIKFYKKTGATGHHLISGADVTLARYVEFKNGKDTAHVTFTKEDAKPGVAKEKSVKVKYSNITDQLEFKMKGGEKSKFSVVSPSVIGMECGDKGEATVTIKFLSNDVDTYKDTLLIQNLNQTVTVYLEAEVDKHHQQITWNPATTDLKTTDNVTFDATTTGSAAGLSVRYSVTEGSDVASVNATTGALTIVKDGSVTIQVDADGDGATYYDAEPVSKTFTISKVKPTITTDPTAETMTLPNTSLVDCDLTGGEASVAGSFDWEDNSVSATYNNSGYKVVFTPKNTNWYDTASCVVVVPVNKQANEITWNFDVTEMFCNAQYAFTGANAATATCSEPAVYYVSSDESIAYVDDAKNLKIIKGGSVTITAKQDGNGTYAAATPVTKTILIKRFAPEIVTKPTAATMKIGRALSDASLTGGQAELDAIKVEGVFAWVDGNTTVMNEAGTFEKQIVFAPSNTNYYDSVYAKLNVTVEKYAPVIEHTLHGSDITYGQALTSSTISGALTATDTVKLPNVEVAGTYAWLNPSAVVNAGNPNPTTALVRFSPANTDWYDVVDFDVPLNVAKAAPVLNVTASEIVIGQKLSQSNLTNSGTPGVCTWDPSLNAETTVYTIEGDYANLPFVFTSSDPNYADGTGVVTLHVNVGFVFNGNDGDWNKGANWQDGNQPGETDNVLVNADVVIDDTITIGSLTIAAGVDVTVKNGASLTINGASLDRPAYGNIHVENGGNLTCGGGEVKVNNFTLDAKLGNTSTAAVSGQVNGDDNLKVKGDAYFQLAVDPCGHNTYGWYDFVVPFEVDVIGGISIAEDPTAQMKFNVNYAVMSYDEAKRAVNGKDWNKFSGTMEPGRVYTITLDETKDWNTVVFKKKAGAPLTGDRSFTTAYSGLGADVDNGWNGFGNGSLFHTELDVPEGTLVQIYDHANKCYQPHAAKDYSIAVGTSFFMQVDEEKTITLAAADDDNTGFMAPTRTRRTVEKFNLSLMNDDADMVYDHLWVGANEEATEAYVIGEDVLKMGTLNAAKIARMWTSKGGHNLCAVNATLSNNQANTPLSLYAPQGGSYWLAIDKAPEDATLYLTYNDAVIWDLTISPYLFDLSKGTTTGYGLRIGMKRTPTVTTDVEQSEFSGQSSVRKVLIDNKVYIVTPEGKMYDIIGKGIKF